MSTTETRPPDSVCDEVAEHGPVEVLGAREVPLGGPRAMSVRRTLPNRARSFVGAWCFADHYGPDDVTATGGMDVPPHPHTGLQTVSWLFAGAIEHRDSAGVHAIVRPGELNLMGAGAGICHSEVSVPPERPGTAAAGATAPAGLLHGVQLWVVLPERDRHGPRSFQHFAPPLAHPAPGVGLRVFLGSLAGQASPVETATPLLGAEVTLAAGTTWRVPVEAAYEHGMLVDTGEVSLCGVPVAPADLGVVDPGPTELTLAATTDARVLLLGGPPFDEEIVMWWNFIGRDHDEIAAFRDAWAAESDRFGRVEGYAGDRLPAPTLPGVRLRPRARHGRR